MDSRSREGSKAWLTAAALAVVVGLSTTSVQAAPRSATQDGMDGREARIAQRSLDKAQGSATGMAAQTVADAGTNETGAAEAAQAPASRPRESFLRTLARRVV